MLIVKKDVFFLLVLTFLFGCTKLKSGSEKKDAGLGNEEDAQLFAENSSSSAVSSFTTDENFITRQGKPSEASESIDEDGCSKQAFYVDNDQDGFGDPDSSILSCEPPEGYVARGDDCDDSCDSCFPGETETCGNGKDENCDGSIDEGCPCMPGEERPCGSDEGECKAGTQVCVEGEWGECSGASEAREEVCDNLDNDCDRETDELASRQCGSDVGACEFGIETCTDGIWICSGGVEPATELCDAQKIDEDCDGNTNENCTCSEGETLECGTDQGICEKGTQRCVNGTFSNTCEGEVKPDPRGEICDGAGLDEDCDGKADVGDEDCDCINGDEEECETGLYVCRPGTKTCNNGRWGSCIGVVNGSAEKCNGKDDDCDGSTDEPPSPWGSLCPSGQTCENGKCVYCGDRIVNGDEECDIGANSDGGDELPTGWVYDKFSCDPNTCKRRYLWTPCSNSTDCVVVTCGSSGWCEHEAGCNNLEMGAPCYMDGGIPGYCTKYYKCSPTCTSSNDCPQHAECVFRATGNYTMYACNLVR